MLALSGKDPAPTAARATHAGGRRVAATDATHDAQSGGHLGPDDHGHGAAVAHDSHAQEPLGPVDWAAWGAGLLGAAVAGIIAVALYLASHP